ncbi:MAG: DUF192 domain-containing protein [Peptococcaceae bacterium]|nr:DUF192 domain-containing protein [Peptococcaceae bacterium]
MIYNYSRQAVVCQEVDIASTFLGRLCGLMFRTSIKATAGLLLTPCRAVHTCFMRFPVDVVFVDRHCRVVGIEMGIKPWRISKVYRTARYALEVPAGRVIASGTKVGDTLGIETYPAHT